MGREASCVGRLGARDGNVTALLESGELVLRGDIRARIPIRALERVAVRGDDLEFTLDGERGSLGLGAVSARRWAAAIAAPGPTLARKLGITAKTRLHATGAIDDDALSAAMTDAAKAVTFEAADLAIVRTDDEAMLEGWASVAASVGPRPPVWIVYRKGRGAPLGERRAREIMRRCGFIDTKVVAVSERLTALRFTKR